MRPAAAARSSFLLTPWYIAVQHMETYWSILEKVKGSMLRLTRYDDDIYTHFLFSFPEFDAAEPIDEDKMKSKGGKERWRKFMMAYEKTVEDYNFGTMLRTSPTGEYEQESTIFGALMPLRLARAACLMGNRIPCR